MDYCDVFISCHSDGTHSLQRIHWRASDGMIHFSKSDEETNSSTFWMAWGWVNHSFISPHKPAVSRMNGKTFRFTKCTDEFLSFWPCRNSQSAAGRAAGEWGVAMETASVGQQRSDAPGATCNSWIPSHLATNSWKHVQPRHVEQLIIDPQFTYFGCVDPSRRFASRRHLLSSSSRTASHVLKDRRQPE